MPSLTGRRAIVTGASAGLGAGIARELVARASRIRSKRPVAGH